MIRRRNRKIRKDPEVYKVLKIEFDKDPYWSQEK